MESGDKLRDLLTATAKKERRLYKRASAFTAILLLAGIAWLSFSVYEVVQLNRRRETLQKTNDDLERQITTNQKILDEINAKLNDSRFGAPQDKLAAVSNILCGAGPPANPSNCDTNQSFIPGCNLPFSGGQAHDIDQRCPNEGCASRDSDKAQNRLKNNLCATGPALEISLTSIDKLQAAVDKLVQQGQLTYGIGGPPQPSDRAKLQGLPTVDASGKSVNLGEGSVVTLDAFVLDARHANSFPSGFKGESVNCKNSLLEWNDIHVALGESASAEECSSVTAEIIPHFRPAVWERFDTNACTSQHVTNPLPLKGLRVKITGQLFFDGSHKPAPCAGATGGGNPLRRSVWEIHPVYAIEVFDTSAQKFVGIDQWSNGR